MAVVSCRDMVTWLSVLNQLYELLFLQPSTFTWLCFTVSPYSPVAFFADLQPIVSRWSIHCLSLRSPNTIKFGRSLTWPFKIFQKRLEKLGGLAFYAAKLGYLFNPSSTFGHLDIDNHTAPFKVVVARYPINGCGTNLLGRSHPITALFSTKTGSEWFCSWSWPKTEVPVRN